MRALLHVKLLVALRDAAADRHYAFWPADLELLDGTAMDRSRVLTSRRVTDVYLLGHRCFDGWQVRHSA